MPPDIRPPFRFGDLVEGGSLIFVLRFGGYEILTMGSMNYIEREMEGLRPDVVLVGAGFSRAEIYDYSGRLMRALGWPSLVIPTHWDNFSLPYDASQDAAIKAKVEPFLDEMKVASPKTRVIVPKGLRANRARCKGKADPLSQTADRLQPRLGAGGYYGRAPRLEPHVALTRPMRKRSATPQTPIAERLGPMATSLVRDVDGQSLCR